MELVIADSIRKREFKRGRISQAELRVLLKGARIELGTVIKGANLPRDTLLLKAYATSPQGPRRILYLLAADDGTFFLLFYRGKSDSLGQNMSPRNPVFKAHLHKHLDLLRADIEAARIEIHPID